MFDSQIVAYCKTMVKREGLLAPPSVLTFAKEEEAYGNMTSYDENVMKEQADRTNAVNEYIEEQLASLIHQISSIPALHTTAETLKTAITSELESLYAGDQ